MEVSVVVTPASVGAGEQVAYPDVGPVLLLSQASVDDLNSRLEQDVTAERFRPNIVIGDCQPFEEVFLTQMSSECSLKRENTPHSCRDSSFFHRDACFSPPVWVKGSFGPLLLTHAVAFSA